MKPGTRISFRGTPGVVVEAEHVTPGMIDIRLDSETFTRRASKDEVGSVARHNGRRSPRRPRRARMNASELEAAQAWRDRTVTFYREKIRLLDREGSKPGALRKKREHEAYIQTLHSFSADELIQAYRNVQRAKQRADAGAVQERRRGLRVVGIEDDATIQRELAEKQQRENAQRAAGQRKTDRVSGSLAPLTASEKDELDRIGNLLPSEMTAAIAQLLRDEGLLAEATALSDGLVSPSDALDKLKAYRDQQTDRLVRAEEGYLPGEGTDRDVLRLARQAYKAKVASVSDYGPTPERRGGFSIAVNELESPLAAAWTPTTDPEGESYRASLQSEIISLLSNIGDARLRQEAAAMRASREWDDLYSRHSFYLKEYRKQLADALLDVAEELSRAEYDVQRVDADMQRDAELRGVSYPTAASKKRIAAIRESAEKLVASVLKYRGEDIRSSREWLKAHGLKAPWPTVKTVRKFKGFDEAVSRAAELRDAARALREGHAQKSADKIAAFQKDVTARFRMSIKDEQSKRKTIEERMGATKASFLTRPDPPRISPDRQGFCGNPIDGTAYYLILNTSATGLTHFLKWSELEAYVSRGRVVTHRVDPATGDVVSEKLLLPETLTTRPVIVKGPDGSAPTQSDVEAAKQEAMAQLGEYANVNPNDVAVWVKPSGSRAYEEWDGEDYDLFAPNRRTQSGSYRQQPYAMIVLKLRSPEYYQALSQAREQYVREMEHRPGKNVVPTVLTPTQFIRAKKVKGEIGKATQVRGEMLETVRRAKVTTQMPGEADYFDFDPVTKARTFYKVYSKRAAVYEKLDQFNIYGFRSAMYPVVIDDAMPPVTVRQAVAEAFDMSYDVADMFIVSCAVAIEGVIETDPYGPVMPNSEKEFGTSLVRINIMLEGKAENPFFSWVRHTLPLESTDPRYREEHGGFSPCLSATEKAAQRHLVTFKRAIQSLNKGLGSVRSLMRRLTENPERLLPEREDPNPRRVGFGRDVSYEDRSRYFSDIRRSVEAIGNGFDKFASACQTLGLPESIYQPNDPSPGAALARELISRSLSGDIGQTLLYGLRLMNQGDAVALGAGEHSAGLQVGLLSGQFANQVRSRSQAINLLDAINEIAESEGSSRARVRLELAQQTLKKEGRQKPTDLAVLSLAGWNYTDGPNSRVLTQSALAAIPDNWGQSTSGVSYTLQGHPADDVIAAMWDDLPSETQTQLEQLRLAALSGGKEYFDQEEDVQVAYRAGRRDVLPKLAEKTDRYAAFMDLSRLASELAQGKDRLSVEQRRGQPTQFNQVDFIYTSVKGLTGRDYGQGAQTDLMWSIMLVIESVYPAMMSAFHTTAPDDRLYATSALIRREVRLLIALLVLYYEIGGYELAGPLNPNNPCSSGTFSQPWRRASKMFRDSYDVARAQRSGTDATAIFRSIVREVGIRGVSVTDSSASTWRAAMLAAYRQNKIEDLAAAVRPFSLGASTLVANSSPAMACADTFLLRFMATSIDDIDADMMGGSVSLSKTGQLTTLMTYNPLLFESTRRMWNTSFTPLKNAEFASELDAVGRWGNLTQYLQKLAFTTNSLEGLQADIYRSFAPFMKQVDLIQMYSGNASLALSTVPKLLRTILRGERQQRKRVDFRGAQYYDLGEAGQIIAGVDPFGEALRVYEPALAFWPLGAGLFDTAEQIAFFLSQPLEYLRYLKTSFVDTALSRMPSYDSTLAVKPSLTQPMQKAFDEASARDTLIFPFTHDADDPARIQLRMALSSILRDQGRDDLAVFAIESDESYAHRLRSLGMKAKQVDKLLRERRAQEDRALRAFQANPGVVRQRTVRQQGRGEDKFLTVELETVPLGRARPELEYAVPMYDPETIDTLRQGMLAYPKQAEPLMPAIDDKEWRREGVTRSGDYTWVGREAIHPDSAVAKVAQESASFTGILSAVDNAIRELDEKIKEM